MEFSFSDRPCSLEKMKEISHLNTQFGINVTGSDLQAEQIKFKSGAGSLTIVNINNRHAKASLVLQGGHLLSWQPNEEENVIWLSEDAIFSKEHSIRGGIPICWPWFGAHPVNHSFPSHGYARTSDWDVVETKTLSDGSSLIVLQLLQDAVSEEYRARDVELDLRVTVGKRLEMSLITRNAGNKAVTIGQAMHTYFYVSDIQNVILSGLENQVYIDALDRWQRKNETNPIMIKAEVDRIYQDTPEIPVYIIDQAFKRQIKIRKQGSHSTVVWNPWIDKSERLGDMGKNGYKNMICVETGNVADDVVMIEPETEHSLSVCYEIESL